MNQPGRNRSVLAAAALAALTVAHAVAQTPLGDWDQRIASALADGKVAQARRGVPGALAAARAGSPDGVSYAAYIDSLGIRFFGAGDDSVAVVLLERGIAVRDSLFEPGDIRLAAPLELLATAYFIVGRLADAVAPQRRALDIRLAAAGENDPRTASCRYDLALVYYRLASYDAAEMELRASLAVREAARDTLAVAETERMLGETCRERNRYDEAETRMKRALLLARAALPGGDPRRVTFLNSLAGYYRDEARYDEAESLIEEAIDIRTRAGMVNELATPTLNLAEIYRYQGRVDDAIPLYQRALELAQQSMAPLEAAEFHNQLAAAYAEAHRLDDAAAEYEKALAIVRDSPHASDQVVAQFEHDYGLLLYRQGKRAAGHAMLEDAIRRREAVFGPSHPLVAASLTALARETMDVPRERDAAAALLDRAIAMLDSTDAEPEAEADARAARAQLYALQGRIGDAVGEMAEALDIVESLRPHRGGGGSERALFMGRYRDYYERITGWEIATGNTSAALAYTERMRARVLVDRLARGEAIPAAVGDDVVARLQERQADLETRLEECQSKSRELRAVSRPTRAQREEIARTEADCDQLVEDLQRARDRLERAASGAPAVEPLDAAGIVAIARRVTPRSGALLVYQIGTRRSFVFLINNAERAPRSFELPVTRTSLTRVLTGIDENGETVAPGVLDALSQPPPGDAGNAVAARARRAQEERLQALFTSLVPEQVWREIRERAEVLLVPDGALFALPFEALITSRNGDRPAFWLDDGPPIRYAPSLSMLDALGPEPPARGEPAVLSVCNPHFGGEGSGEAAGASWLARTRYGGRGGSLSPLPGTEREGESVVAVFGKQRVTVLRGDAATEAAFRKDAPDKSILHVATHGLVSQRRSDLLAALAFTPVSASDLNDDGFLQMFEIYRLRLPARLVVLSACESSHGRYVEGEGVMALSNGFHAAGSREVVATLWKVDDDASASLVSAFFTRVARGWNRGGDVTVALRDAKRELRANPATSHPFYWAAFTVSGRP